MVEPNPVNYELLKTTVDELDWSHDELAKRMKLSKGYVRNVLYGTDKPSRRVLRRFERVLGLEKYAADAADPQGVPTEPPKQPRNEPKGPPARREEPAGPGPRRVEVA